MPVRFALRVLRRTFGAEMRRRAVLGWDVSGQFGHTGHAEATTERYSPHFGERIWEAVDVWMEDLARDVPKLRGVMSGTVAATKENGQTSKDLAVQPLNCGGRYRVRTCDPYHVKVVLYR